MQFELFTELLEHQPSHVEKEFVCYVCKQCCSTAHLLALHAKTHMFGCQNCPKKFPSKQQLNHHLGLVHGMPILVIQCTVCTYICLERAEFHVHFNHDHRKFKCNFCTLGFQLQSQLDKHISEKHPEVTMANTADTAISAPQMAPPATQLRVPKPAPTPSLPVPVPALTPHPPSDTTAEQTDMPDMSTSSEPNLDTTGTDTTKGDQNPTDRSNRMH